MSDNDRRRHPRLPLRAKVWLHSSETVYLMNIVNLSRCGALIDSGKPTPPEGIRESEQVRLYVFCVDDEGVLELDGAIVRTEQEGDRARFGIDFDALAEGTLARLDGLLDRIDEYPPDEVAGMLAPG